MGRRFGVRAAAAACALLVAGASQAAAESPPEPPVVECPWTSSGPVGCFVRLPLVRDRSDCTFENDPRLIVGPLPPGRVGGLDLTFDNLVLTAALDRDHPLVERMLEWRRDPRWARRWIHVERWDRALAAFGVGCHPRPMSLAEAEVLAARGWKRWAQVAEAMKHAD